MRVWGVRLFSGKGRWVLDIGCRLLFLSSPSSSQRTAARSYWVHQPLLVVRLGYLCGCDFSRSWQVIAFVVE